MLLEIKKYPDPILKQNCQEVGDIKELKDFIQDMAKTMEEKDGIGLAAPQVGRLERIIVVQTEKGSTAFINPKILKKSKKTEIVEEGCLSFPGVWLKIKRSKEIEVEALNIDGDKINIKAQGIFARVLQHEIDHLNGILFINRAGFFQRLKIKKQPCR